MSYSANPTYPLLPVISFLGFFLVLIPFPWHLQAWNAGTCVYMIWVAISCLIQFVNSIIWRNSALNVAPVWCDISTKLLIGASIGIPASALCISHRLYTIAVIKTASATREDKWRALIIDLSISIGIPVIVMALHYIVQGHRFDILEDVGCWPATYNVIPAYFLVYMWPSLLGCISFVYSGLAFAAFYKRRMTFNSLMAGNSPMNANRYVRLMMLSVIEMAFTVPISIYSVYISGTSIPMQSWVSFSDTHYNFSYIGLIPAAEWTSNSVYKRSIDLTQWLFPVCAFMFFALFGFASEARKHYRPYFLWIAKRFGYNPPVTQTWRPCAPRLKAKPIGTLPVYSTPAPPRIKLQSSFTHVLDLKSSDVYQNVEKYADLPSPLPPYSKEKLSEDLSRTSSKYSRSHVEACTIDTDLETPSEAHSWQSSRERRTAHYITPAYHRSFSSPSLYPAAVDLDGSMQSSSASVAIVRNHTTHGYL
ncbi:pheromone A receptor-domain-containing protein [Suillus subaureus]|uniref:Pheromone A receptor-domain-containing protein n=1 Tax=Suillus subaureus TaxID=48587 RepID=A0A9P7EBW5_9AGAM|nr:pheromone A receptor-domain-containing protein [Suillus subaureus]KAG1816849.1 pheromone A receptor-domain-containing protein [Suillus subaureus]